MLRERVESFLASCRRPAVVEPGDPPILLRPETYSLECRGGKLLLEAWDDERNLARRLTGIVESRTARLTIAVERFGGKEGRLTLVDLDRPESAPALLRGRREELREQFRHWLERQFCGWTIAELSTSPDLEHTLSPVYPRALLTRGTSRVAAVCSPEGEAEADAALTFGLIWLAYLRKREQPHPVQGLVLFLPAGRETNTLLRLRYLNEARVKTMVFRYHQDGFEQQVDGDDTGNLLERLQPWTKAAPVPACEAERWAHRLSLYPDVETVDLGRGVRSFRVRGLEFARLSGDSLQVGVDRKRPARSLESCESLASEIARERNADNASPSHRWRLRNPESWLESTVRRQLSALDPLLDPDVIYGQVCAVSGRDRGLIDLLARDITGRLAVIEIKATEDPCLPVQALDYWIRVRSHVLSGEFESCGYFPDKPLSEAAPRLLLVAPALQFHPTTETLLGFYAPEIEVERIGLGVEWQRNLRVILRLRGAQRPDQP